MPQGRSALNESAPNVHTYCELQNQMTTLRYGTALADDARPQRLSHTCTSSTALPGTAHCAANAHATASLSPSRPLPALGECTTGQAPPAAHDCLGLHRPVDQSHYSSGSAALSSVNLCQLVTPGRRAALLRLAPLCAAGPAAVVPPPAQSTCPTYTRRCPVQPDAP